MDIKQLYNLELQQLVLIALKSDSINPLVVQYIHSGNLHENAIRKEFVSYLKHWESAEAFQDFKTRDALTNKTIIDFAFALLNLQDGIFYLLSRSVPLVNRIKSLKRKISKGSVEKYIQNIQCTDAQIDLHATYNVLMSQLKLTEVEKVLLKLTLNCDSEIDLSEMVQAELTFTDFFQIAVCCASIPSMNTCWEHKENTERMKLDLINKGNEITALHLGILTGKLAVVDWLFDQNFPIEAGDENGDTGMHFAASSGHDELVVRLITSGASCNARNKVGKTPLHKAAEGGHTSIGTLLISSGAEIDARNQCGNTPLIGAAEKGHRHIVELLLNHGADIYASNDRLNSCLHRAAFQGYTDVVELILKKTKDNIEAQNMDGKTPLHIAAERGNFKVAELLTETKAEINSRNKFGQTPLHVAAWKGYHGIVELLLNCGAVSKAVDSKKRTALHEAAWNGHYSIVELLLKNSDINAVDYNNDTALCLAKKFKKDDIVELLMMNGAV